MTNLPALQELLRYLNSKGVTTLPRARIVLHLLEHGQTTSTALAAAMNESRAFVWTFLDAVPHLVIRARTARDRREVMVSLQSEVRHILEGKLRELS